MPITIGSNIASLNAQRQLGKASESLSSTYTRLSSGLRINKASDDAAGLAISTSLNSDAQVFTQGVRNLNDGVSLLSIAQGALEQLSIIATRGIELSEQAANGTYSAKQRAALEAEANTLVKEWNRITQSTTFNGRQILNGDLRSGLGLQAGYGSDGILSLNVSEELSRNIGNGNFTDGVSNNIGVAGDIATTLDFEGDGDDDLFVYDVFGAARLLKNNGDGTFSVHTIPPGTVHWSGPSIGDFNGDGVKDFINGQNTSTNTAIILGNADGSFRAPITFSNLSTGTVFHNYAIGDYNNDGLDDIATTDFLPTSTFKVLLSNGDGTFRVTQTATGLTVNPTEYDTGDINGDGNLDFVLFQQGNGPGVQYYLGNGNGTFRAPVSIPSLGGWSEDGRLLDLNDDGFLDLVSAVSTGGDGIRVALGNGNGSFKAPSTFGTGTTFTDLLSYDYNNDGINDIVASTASSTSIFVGDGSGSFSLATTVGYKIQDFGQFTNDGVLDGVRLSGTSSIITNQNTDKSTSHTLVDLSTQKLARSSLETFQASLTRVSSELGKIGSFQSRLDVASNVLQVSRENYFAAESRIKDADIASEAAELTKQNILQQVSASILAQANQQPALALELLRG